MRRLLLCLILAMFSLTLAACFIPGPHEDTGTNDSGPITDADIRDAEADSVKTDGKPEDGPDAQYDGIMSSTGELLSGSAVSTGGKYTLISQVGHAVEPKAVKGGDYELQWNVSVIPW